MNTYTVIINKNFEIVTASNKSKTILNLVKILKKQKGKKDKGELVCCDRRYQYTRLKFVENTIVTFTDLSELNKLSDLAWIDQLTGLFNRHAYWRIITNVLHECTRDNLEVGVIFLDIDNLKKINTSKGYVGGDRVISGIAKILLNTVRKTDYCFRLGGDEFLIIAKFRSEFEDAFEKLIQKLRKNIGNKSKNLSTATIGGVLIKNGELKDLETSKRFKNDWLKIIEKIDKIVINEKQERRDRIAKISLK